MTHPGMMLVNLRGGARALTLREVMERYHIAADEIDETFGLIEVDDIEHIYTIRVSEAAAARIDARFRASGDIEGTYGDIRIEPFGPPV